MNLDTKVLEQIAVELVHADDGYSQFSRTPPVVSFSDLLPPSQKYWMTMAKAAVAAVEKLMPSMAAAQGFVPTPISSIRDGEARVGVVVPTTKAGMVHVYFAHRKWMAVKFSDDVCFGCPGYVGGPLVIADSKAAALGRLSLEWGAELERALSCPSGLMPWDLVKQPEDLKNSHRHDAAKLESMLDVLCLSDDDLLVPVTGPLNRDGKEFRVHCLCPGMWAADMVEGRNFDSPSLQDTSKRELLRRIVVDYQADLSKAKKISKFWLPWNRGIETPIELEKLEKKEEPAQAAELVDELGSTDYDLIVPINGSGDPRSKLVHVYAVGVGKWAVRMVDGYQYVGLSLESKSKSSLLRKIVNDYDVDLSAAERVKSNWMPWNRGREIPVKLSKLEKKEEKEIAGADAQPGEFEKPKSEKTVVWYALVDSVVRGPFLSDVEAWSVTLIRNGNVPIPGSRSMVWPVEEDSEPSEESIET